jgi:hypothetical protein
MADCAMKLFALMVVLMVAPAHAQTTLQNGTFPLHCSDSLTATEDLIEIAFKHYKETPMFVGKMGPGALIVTANKSLRSWTVIITKPGQSCFFASGESFILLPPVDDELLDENSPKVEM